MLGGRCEIADVGIVVILVAVFLLSTKYLHMRTAKKTYELFATAQN